MADTKPDVTIPDEQPPRELVVEDLQVGEGTEAVPGSVVTVHYVGHASSFDEAVVDGSIAAGDATVRYRKAGRLLAAASIGRPHENLAMEAEMEAAVSARAGESSASGGPA